MTQRWDTELYEAKHGFVWQLGQGVLELLNPQAGERILDLGCGTGQLTEKIAAARAAVVGVDSSPDMVGQARQNYPALQFRLENATKLPFESEFDAVFSNAVLHWVQDADAAARGIARALKPRGRFVAELGGCGNIGRIEAAIRRVLGSECPPSPWYYPSIAQYATVLEGAGLEPQFMQLFDRPTPLEGERGMQDWLQQFASSYFTGAARAALPEVVQALRPELYRDGKWFADYRRLRVIAVKTT